MFRFTNQDGEVSKITEQQALKLLLDDAKNRLKALEGNSVNGIALPTGTVSWAEDNCHFVLLMFGSFRAVLEDYSDWSLSDIENYWLAKDLSPFNFAVFNNGLGVPSLGEGNPKEYLIYFRDNGDGAAYEQKIKAVHPFIAATCLWQVHGKSITITEMYKIENDYTVRCETECFWPKDLGLPNGWYEFFEDYYRIKRMKEITPTQKAVKQGAITAYLESFVTEFGSYFGGIDPSEIDDRMHYGKPHLKLKAPFMDMVLNIPKINL